MDIQTIISIIAILVVIFTAYIFGWMATKDEIQDQSRQNYTSSNRKEG